MTSVPKYARSLRLGPQGRLVIPADMRRALHVEPGDALVAWLEDDRLVVRPRRAVQEELWRMMEGVPVSSDDILEERRLEAARE